MLKQYHLPPFHCWMDSCERVKKRLFQAMIFKHTNMLTTNIEGRQFVDAMTNLAVDRGQVKEAGWHRFGDHCRKNQQCNGECLINTTGIEPLCGDLSDVLSRTFTINFDLSYQTSDCFIETKVIADIQKHRDLILSALMKRTAQVLARIEAEAREQVMGLIKQSVGNHDKRRCNDYLSVMYLMLTSGDPEGGGKNNLKELQPEFINWIKSLNQTSRKTARESNPIAANLHALFNAHRTAVELDEEFSYSATDHDKHLSSFIEEYQIRFQDQHTMEPLFAGQLLAAMKRVSREFSLNLAFKDAGQLAKRLINDKELLADAVFSITPKFHSK